jgi:hypothetical protein
MKQFGDGIPNEVLKEIFPRRLNTTHQSLISTVSRKELSINENKVEPRIKNLIKCGNIVWLIGVLTVVNPQFSFAHDPQGWSVASTWSIVIVTVIGIAASYFSFRFFFPMTVGSRPTLRFIVGALAIIIPFVVVWPLILPLVFAIIYGSMR